MEIKIRFCKNKLREEKLELNLEGRKKRERVKKGWTASGAYLVTQTRSTLCSLPLSLSISNMGLFFLKKKKHLSFISCVLILLVWIFLALNKIEKHLELNNISEKYLFLIILNNVIYIVDLTKSNKILLL